MAERIGCHELYPVTEDEATELCLHHLRLAWVYYMNVPEDDNKSILAELDRAQTDPGEKTTIQTFLESCFWYHHKLKQRWR